MVWIDFPSLRSSARSPFSHISKRRLRQVMWSRVLDFAWGFWRSRVGIVMAALMAKASIGDSVAYASKKRASSATNFFPQFPDGSMNRLGIQ